MIEYNPSAVGIKGSIFGYPYSEGESDLILIPIPWDVTVSYAAGTSQSPEIILTESSQLDFSMPSIQNVHEYPVAMAPVNGDITRQGAEMRKKAKQLINQMETSGSLGDAEILIQNEIDGKCAELMNTVKNMAFRYLNQGKIVGSIGGDHSTPLGLIQALGEKHESFGILQIDAHMDLRKAYEGFEFSHASIMYNAMKVPSVSHLVQVGIRDYCLEEEQFAQQLNGKVMVHYDEVLKRSQWEGVTWNDQTNAIVDQLPDKVYISFDMDGLDPTLCPNTGTPVPGGLNFYEAVSLIEAVVKSGRQIVGFDVSETGNNAWDANVAARIIFRLCAYVGVSRGRLSFI